MNTLRTTQWRPWRMAATLLSVWSLAGAAQAQPAEAVVDVPTRPGVTVRALHLASPEARASVILLAGGHGGLQLGSDGRIGWGGGNFLVRTRARWAAAGLHVLVPDAPSDRQSPPFLSGQRQKPEHLADVEAMVAWLRARSPGPVWLVGTSRGTQSAAFVGTELPPPRGPDGLVLTATILSDPQGRAVPAMPLERLKVPVLLVHHRQDGCSHCAPERAPALLAALGSASRSELLWFDGGINRGDPCEAAGHHGFAGLEAAVVEAAAAWVLR